MCYLLGHDHCLSCGCIEVVFGQEENEEVKVQEEKEIENVEDPEASSCSIVCRRAVCYDIESRTNKGN